jgi:hypothetical protein
MHEAPRGVALSLDDPEEQMAVYVELMGEKAAVKLADPMPELPQTVSPLNKSMKRLQPESDVTEKQTKRFKG